MSYRYQRPSREERRAQRLENVNSAMEIFSPKRELDILGTLALLRGQGQAQQREEQTLPLDLERMQTANRAGMTELAFLPERYAEESQGRQLSNASQYEQLRDVVRQRMLSDEDQAMQRQKHAWEGEDRQYTQQRREVMDPLQEELVASQAINNYLQTMFGAEFNPAIAELLKRRGLPFNVTAEAPQTPAPEALMKLFQPQQQ